MNNVLSFLGVSEVTIRSYFSLVVLYKYTVLSHLKINYCSFKKERVSSENKYFRNIKINIIMTQLIFWTILQKWGHLKCQHLWMMIKTCYEKSFDHVLRWFIMLNWSVFFCPHHDNIIHSLIPFQRLHNLHNYPYYKKLTNLLGKYWPHQTEVRVVNSKYLGFCIH